MNYIYKLKKILLRREGIYYLENTDSLSLPKIVTSDSIIDALSYHNFKMLKEEKGYYTFSLPNENNGNLIREENMIYAVSLNKTEAVKLDLSLLLKELGISSGKIWIDKYTHLLTTYSVVGKICDHWFSLEEKTIKEGYSYKRVIVLDFENEKYIYEISKDRIILYKHILSNSIENKFDISYNDITTQLTDGKRSIRLNVYIDRNDLNNGMLVSLSNIMLKNLYGKIFDAYYSIKGLLEEYDIEYDSFRVMQINQYNRIIQSIDIVSDNLLFVYVYVTIDGKKYKCDFNEEGYVKCIALNNDGVKDDIDYIDNKCIKLTKELKQRSLRKRK